MTKEEVNRLYLLTRHEFGVLGGGGGNPNDWSFEIPVNPTFPRRQDD
ncbi:MAG: hypothetical protein WKF41_05465 [Gaiellaceae bacterium]